MARYKVKLPTDMAFRQALDLVQGEAPLFVCSEKRRTLSVGDLPEEVERRIFDLGGRVTVEDRYDLEASAIL